MSRTHKNEYSGSKKFDVTCRNHGACSYCRDNRTYSSKHRLVISSERDDLQSSDDIDIYNQQMHADDY